MTSGNPNTMRRALYHGDNLPSLRSLPDWSVDLIATDPPYNTGRDFGVYTDRWNDSHHEGETLPEDVAALVELAGRIHGGGMAAYLAWLGVRLTECWRVLVPRGSLYLQCPPETSGYLRVLLDSIGGNFRNVITWQRTSSHNDSNRYGNVVDHLLYYGKGDRVTWNPQYTEYSERQLSRYRRR